MARGQTSATVTVLFTDLVGSTELMTRLGDAGFDRLRGDHFGQVREALAGRGGQEVKTTGDGLLATFTSAVDALAAAVAIQQATARHARTSGVAVAVRVGLSIGEVACEDGDVFGSPVVEAARLVAAAAPGQTLTTAVVRLLAGSRAGVGFSDLGTRTLKGLADPVTVCEVAWAPLPAALVPLPSLLTGAGRVFVGRDDELGRLEQLWKEAAAGEFRGALVAGEPGVGKTRLAAELGARVHAEGATVLAGACDEDLGVPYQPFVEALRHLVDHAAPGELLACLGRHPGELVRLVPELAERVPGLPAPLRSDPETERYRLFDAVTACLEAVAHPAPLLVVVDDLQWAAKPTLLLLRHVARGAGPARVLVLGTYRDTELGRTHPLAEFLGDLRRREGMERISLAGLDVLGVAAYMERAAGHPLEDQDRDLARAIYDETEGNPFFVREVLRHLAETGGITEHEGRWTAGLPIEEIGIPEGVRDVVGRRLSRLSEATNEILAIAAVAGLDFALPVVAAASGAGDDRVLAAVDEAVAARLVDEVAGVPDRCRFAHALVRDTLYHELTGPRRVALHRRVAQAIETVHGDRLDDHLPALAHHYARAAAPADGSDKAIDYATRAGDRALAQLAHDEAAAYYGQALELLGASSVGADDSRRQELLISLGEAQRRAGDSAHRQTLLDAARLARERGDADALARAALTNHRGLFASVVGIIDAERVETLEAALNATGADNTPTRARLLASLAQELMFGHERERRVGLSDKALAIARHVGEPGTLAHVLLQRFLTIAAPDTLTERLSNTAELLRLANQLHDPVVESRARFLRFRATIEAGDIDEADRCLEAAETMTSELGQPTLSWQVQVQRAARTLMAGDVATAERLVAASFELGEAAGQPDAHTYFVAQQFAVRLDQGRLDELVDELAETVAAVPGLPILGAFLALSHTELDRLHDARTQFERVAANAFARVPVDNTWPSTMACWAGVCHELDDSAHAELLHRSLVPYAEQIAFTSAGVLGSLSHHLGLLATTLAHFEEAEAHFAAAARTHERIGAPTWLARTRLEWARMLLAQRHPGDVDQARQLLHQALATARELGLGNVERRAAALLG